VSPRLVLRLDGDAYAPGDVVRGTVDVHGGGRSRRLDVLLLFHERSDDYSRVARTVEIGPLHEGDLPSAGSFPFELRLPEDALPAYRSSHGELYWEVDARSDELGRDTHARERLNVLVP
jgi:hypothetical protein